MRTIVKLTTTVLGLILMDCCILFAAGSIEKWSPPQYRGATVHSNDAGRPILNGGLRLDITTPTLPSDYRTRNGATTGPSTKSHISAKATNIPASERQALIDLYNATDGDHWTHNSGWKTPPLDSDGFSMPGTEASWYGVTLSTDGSTVTELDLHGNNLVGTISALTLPDLANLNCGYNHLTALDVHANTNLKTLICDYNQLTALEVSANTNLTILYCGHNQLTALDIHANTNLTHLRCTLNQLTSLDVHANTALQFLYCDSNQLTSLDVHANTALQILDCHYNQITALDVHANTNLTKLYSYSNPLTVLDVHTNTNLTYLSCSYNQLTTLDVHANTNLTKLYCGYNQLTALDVSANTALHTLYCQSNQLTDIPDVTGLSHLTIYYCYDNYFNADDCPTISAIEAMGLDTFQYNTQADGYTLDCSGSTATHTITASAGTGGTISPSGSQECYDGSSQIFHITPDTGYHIADVTVDSSSVGAVTSYTFTNVTADHSIVVSFAIDTHTITASAGANGTISPGSSVIVNDGADQSFTITADTGYHVSDVTVDGNSVGAVTSYTFTGVTADHTISASFAIDTFTLTYSAGTGGTISGTSPQTVNYGADGTAVTAQANTGYDFVNWSDGSTANPRTDTNVTADMTVTANFTIQSFTITASAGANGTISPEGTLAVNYGDRQTFMFTPDSGYHVSDVIVDGASVGASQHYTFDNITANHNISVSFSSNIPPVIDSFTADRDSGNAPLTVNFTCNAHDPDGGDIVRYSWNITGRRSDTVITGTGTLAYRFIIPGNYNISVTVTDDEGETATATLNTGSAENGINVARSEPMAIPLPSLIQINALTKDGNGSASIQTTAVNEFNDAATVTLEAKTASGETMGSSAINVPANGSAVLTTDSFDGLSYDSVQATTDRHLLLFSKVSTDTAKMTAELSTMLKSPLYAPHIAEETDYWNTYAYLSNSNPLMLDVTVAGITASHTAAAADILDLESLLPADAQVADAWGKLMAYASNPFSNTNSLSGFEMFIKDGSDGAATELVSENSTILYVPHIPEESDIFWTGFALLNTGSSPATVTATFYDDNGNIVGTKNLTIPANSKIKGLMTDLFEDEAGTARWGTFQSDQPINGIEIYGTYNAGICGLTLPMVANSWGILPDVLTGENNWTGIAITNVTGTDATVTIRLVGADGTVKAEKTETIAAMHRFKAVVADYFDNATLETGDTIRYSSDQPIIALEAGGDMDRTFMTALTGSR